MTLRCASCVTGLVLALVGAAAFAAFAADDDTDDASAAKTMQATGAQGAAKALGRIRLPDPQVRDNLREGLIATKTIEPREIHTNIADGVVTLRGRVGSVAERNLIDAVVRTTPGVQRIANNLRVDPPRAAPWPVGDPRGVADVAADARIREAARKVLAESGQVRMGDLRIEVYLGVVIVAGPVPSEAVREKVRSIALYAEGVRAVVNHTWAIEP